MYFLLKSDVQGELEKVLDYLKNRMKEFCGDNFDVTKSQPPSKVKCVFALCKCIKIQEYGNCFCF